MGILLENKRLSRDFFLMKVQEKNRAAMGQFYMLRAWDTYPVLSRPISVFDRDPETVTFLYKVVGQGTRLLSQLRPGSSVTLDGPHGNGFPRELTGRIALVGGGVGIAPLYMTAKAYHKPGNQVDLYLGFSDEALLEDAYREVCSSLKIDVGGFITDHIDPCGYDHILTCGPEIMMRVLYKKCVDTGARAPLYVSMENRMACGIGACLVCACATSGGNRKVCKDGPVFLGEEVFGNA